MACILLPIPKVLRTGTNTHAITNEHDIRSLSVLQAIHEMRQYNSAIMLTKRTYEMLKDFRPQAKELPLSSHRIDSLANDACRRMTSPKNQKDHRFTVACSQRAEQGDVAFKPSRMLNAEQAVKSLVI